MTTRTTDGGYYALRGFTYQFDHSLLTVCTNPTSQVSIEYMEDESYEDYCVQIKNRESTAYTPSAIRKPVRQLLDLSLDYPDKKFILHCHFKDRVQETQILTLESLDQILGSSVDDIDEVHRRRFASNFKLRFAEDYEAQFKTVIAIIKKSFNCSDEAHAVQVHAVLQAGLIRIAQSKVPEDRKVTLSLLQNLVKTNAAVIFQAAYRDFLGTEAYRKLLHSKYFTFNRSGIPNFERLFIIDCDSTACAADLVELVRCISQKYFKANKSPAPYVCLRNCKNEVETKQCMWDAGIVFNDGTNFNGDRFRPDQLLHPATLQSGVRVKLVGDADLSDVISSMPVREMYEFFIDTESRIKCTADRVRRIKIDSTLEVVKIID